MESAYAVSTRRRIQFNVRSILPIPGNAHLAIAAFFSGIDRIDRNSLALMEKRVDSRQQTIQEMVAHTPGSVCGCLAGNPF